MKSAQKEKQNVHGRRPGPMVALAQKCRDALSFSDTCAATEYPFHEDFVNAGMGRSKPSAEGGHARSLVFDDIPASVLSRYLEAWTTELAVFRLHEGR
jgi:hypothetical protein